MPNHIHLVTDSQNKAKRVLQFVNGIVSRRVIDFLKVHGHERSLKKLQHEEYRRGHKYSLWDHHPNIRLLTSEEMFMQRVNYTHQNPVRAGLVTHAEEYRFSSARIWKGEPLADEPLMIDLDELNWRSKKGVA
jgi:REP element-mobilizing transposase RayT